MTIFTWNVRYENKIILKGLEFICSLNPDVICLQEFPKSKLDEIKNSTSYHVTITEDFIGHNKKIKKRKDGCILILTKEKPLSQQIFNYYEQQKSSLLGFFYKKVSKVEEQHKAIEVTISVENKPIKIVNARLSCAISSQERLKQLGSLLKRADDKTIFAGDFNIVDGFFFKFLTGWLRAYSLFDYKIKEREKAEQLFNFYNLSNIFNRIKTSAVPFLRLQLDHILIPKNFPIFDKKKYKNRFFSDHHILYINTCV